MSELKENVDKKTTSDVDESQRPSDKTSSSSEMKTKECIGTCTNMEDEQSEINGAKNDTSNSGPNDGSDCESNTETDQKTEIIRSVSCTAENDESNLKEDAQRTFTASAANVQLAIEVPESINNISENNRIIFEIPRCSCTHSPRRSGIHSIRIATRTQLSEDDIAESLRNTYNSLYSKYGSRSWVNIQSNNYNLDENSTVGSTSNISDNCLIELLNGLQSRYRDVSPTLPEIEPPVDVEFARYIPHLDASPVSSCDEKSPQTFQRNSCSWYFDSNPPEIEPSAAFAVVDSAQWVLSSQESSEPNCNEEQCTERAADNVQCAISSGAIAGLNWDEQPIQTLNRFRIGLLERLKEIMGNFRNLLANMDNGLYWQRELRIGNQSCSIEMSRCVSPRVDRNAILRVSREWRIITTRLKTFHTWFSKVVKLTERELSHEEFMDVMFGIRAMIHVVFNDERRNRIIFENIPAELRTNNDLRFIINIRREIASIIRKFMSFASDIKQIKEFY